jgi:hypothetical protein
MRYISVEWPPDDPELSIRCHLEIDDDHMEVRKIEVYMDGAIRRASKDHSEGNTELSWEPTPPNEEIAADPQFVLREITAEEFEALWSGLV